MKKRRGSLAMVAAILCGVAAQDAAAADKIVAVRSGIDIAFAALEIGDTAKIWQGLDLDVQVLEVPGTRIEQVLTSGDADVGLGAGIALGQRLKGVPTIGVASVAGPPNNFTLLVTADSPIHTIADLKGRSVAVTTAGAVTEWLVRELSRRQGWGPDGIKTVPLGDETARMAALRTGGVDADLGSLMQSFDFADKGQGRILVFFGDVVTNFQTLVLKASDRFIDQHPDLLKRFLKGWFQSVAYMKAHPDVGIKVVAENFKIDPAAVAKAYPIEMKMLSDDGTFDAAGMEVIRHSLLELHLVDRLPEMSDLYTDRFVPVSVK
jgi:ABC-type nitrate/sulfonate/bicarbonate transport system substrate-binding protein